MLGHNPSDTIEYDDADMCGDHHRRVTTLVNSNDTMDSLSANSVHRDEQLPLMRIKIGGGDGGGGDDVKQPASMYHQHHSSKHPRSDAFEAVLFASSVSKMMSPIKSPIYNDHDDGDEEDEQDVRYIMHKARNSTLEIHGLINM
mmetsp:Transcript_53630/g.88959  ORF Transcript_53630/g.88959 Transcript_53630/m.88959 type:complete len:144 (-) Transcript_53630:59-490(-)